MNDQSEQDASPPDNESTAAQSRPGSNSDSSKKWLPPALVALATLIGVVSILSTWVKVQLLETDQWVTVSDQLLDEPEITGALAAYLVDQLYSQLDIEGEFETRLPEDLKGLAGPISGALRDPATKGAERLVTSDRFRTTWLTVNEKAHQALVNILRDETREGVSATDGEVTLELGVLLRIVGEDLGLPDSLLDRLPKDAGNISIIEADELAAAQAGVRILDFLSWFLFLAVVALYALAVYLDRHRWTTRLQSVGIGIIGAGVFTLLLRQVSISTVVDSTVSNPQQRPLATLTGWIATELIRQMAWSAVVYGVLITGFATLLGTHRWAAALRRLLAPVFGASPGIVAGATAMLLLALLTWSPGRAFDRWVTGVTLIALVAGGVVALRRATQQTVLKTTDHNSNLDKQPSSQTT